MVLLLRGRLTSGVGEGARYVEIYRRALSDLLGSDPYPGTLNLELDTCFYDIASRFPPLRVKPPHSGLGEVFAFRGWVGNIRVLVLKPIITSHDCNTVEVVSSVHLRSHLKLKDGDFIEIVVET